MRKTTVLAALVSTWVILILAAEVEGFPKESISLSRHRSSYTWFLEDKDPNQYEKFIDTLLDQLMDEDDDCFDIPMLTRPLHNITSRKVRSSQGNTVDIYLDTRTLDLIGYKDRPGYFQSRIFVFKNTPHHDFYKTAEVIELEYTNNLDDIRSNNIVDIDKLGVSKYILDDRLDKIYGRPTDDEGFKKDQMEFIVMLLRMLVGSLRFTYIQDQIIEHYEDKVFFPDRKMVQIEGSWEKISKLVEGASEDGILPENLLWPVNNVDAVKGDLGVVENAKEGICAVNPGSLRFQSWFPLAFMLNY